jgi:hypothetical protein
MLDVDRRKAEPQSDSFSGFAPETRHSASGH